MEERPNDAFWIKEWSGPERSFLMTKNNIKDTTKKTKNLNNATSHFEAT